MIRISGQRVHAEEQAVLTGSAFHISREKILETLWISLLRHSRYPQIVKRISLFAPDSRHSREKLDGPECSPLRVAPVSHVLLVSLRFHERRPKKGQLTWEHLVVSANVSLTGTCVRNFRIILGKYLNVKLAGRIILKDRLHTDGVGQTCCACFFGAVWFV